MVIHNPFRLIPNYNEFLGVYEKLLRKIFDNSWVKVVPFHMIALCCSDESEVMDFLLQTNRQSSSLNLTTYFIEVSISLYLENRLAYCKRCAAFLSVINSSARRLITDISSRLKRTIVSLINWRELHEFLQLLVSLALNSIECL